MKNYIIERAKGLAIGCLRYSEAEWGPCGNGCVGLDEARKELARMIGNALEVEDRGEEYEAEWQDLISRAQTADAGDVLAFDEKAWRIVEDYENA